MLQGTGRTRPECSERHTSVNLGNRLIPRQENPKEVRTTTHHSQSNEHLRTKVIFKAGRVTSRLQERRRTAVSFSSEAADTGRKRNDVFPVLKNLLDLCVREKRPGARRKPDLRGGSSESCMASSLPWKSPKEVPWTEEVGGDVDREAGGRGRSRRGASSRPSCSSRRRRPGAPGRPCKRDGDAQGTPRAVRSLRLPGPGAVRTLAPGRATRACAAPRAAPGSARAEAAGPSQPTGRWGPDRFVSI